MSVAGEKYQGRKGGSVGWHGTQSGTAKLSERKVRVRKPRLRRKGQGKGCEVEIPAYEAINGGSRMAERIVEILKRNGSRLGSLGLLRSRKELSPYQGL